MARQSIYERLKSYFLTGLLVITPAIATLYILFFLFNFLDSILRPFVQPIIKDKYITGISLALLVVLIIFVGAIIKITFFGKFLESFEKRIMKLPFIGGIYSTVKETSVILLGERKFLGVVLVEFPGKGNYSIGFKTGKLPKRFAEEIKKVKGIDDRELIYVYVPTTPNPTTGFLIAVKEDEIIDIDLSVEEAAKIILSGGIARNYGEDS